MNRTIPDGWPRITPALHYADPGRAADWLEKAFGFETRSRLERPDGSVGHVELALEDGLIMLWPNHDDCRSPQAAGSANQQLYVFVEDVDAHFARAREAGAKLLAEPQNKEYGHRNYGAEDLEGHVWWFWGRPRE